MNERLTENRSERTWRLYRMSWYVTVALSVISLLLALFFFSRMWHGYASNIAAGSTIMMAFVVIACLLLMGAGLSRFQARLEGQHLEIKLTLNRLSDQLERLRAQVAATGNPANVEQDAEKR